MKLKVITGLVFLIGMLTLAFNIQPVRAEPRTWTVDDDGPADFSSIQEAINAANSGDTIIVSEGMYAEGQINVTKSLTILANGAAVVDGLGKFYVFNVVAHQVTISGFTVMNGLHTGIFVTSNHNLIQNNKVENITQTGISLFSSHFSVIENNTLLNNGDGMQIGHSTYNTVKKNRAIGKYAGMLIYYSDFNSFESNIVSGSVYYGFRISESSRNNSVVENTVIDSNVGINIFGDSDYNNIYHNSLINNIKHASSSDSINIWDDGYPSGGNYWSDYNGTDFFHGSYQNETGPDGIGDIPYVIDDYNRDNYPLVSYIDLNATHYELLSNYDELREDYVSLQGNYLNLSSSYNNLKTTYDDLESKYDTTINELNNIRNLIYVSTTIIILLIATTIYFAVRKPKVKPSAYSSS